jgi:pimeloyl-ACP methyl ester carboxylesterase
MTDDSQLETRDCTLQLRDNRTLGYTVFLPSGASGGSISDTLFYFGSSRWEARILAGHAQQAGIRLIGTDRPGMGGSDFQKGRRLLDWPADVIELADGLRIDRFAVVGVSGGGPFALACAHAIPKRLTACGVVSSVGPVRLRFYQHFPWLLVPMMGLMSLFYKDKERARKAVINFTRGWPEADRRSLLVPEIRDLWVDSWKRFAKAPKD